MAQQCDAQSLINAVNSDWGNIPPGFHFPIAIELAAQIAGVSSNPQSLVNTCDFLCIPPGYELPVAIALACEALGTSSSTVSITIPTDPDAAAFVCSWLVNCLQLNGCTVSTNCVAGAIITTSATCAKACGYSGTIVTSISTLVSQLKAAGLWNIMDAIYPFVGGTAASCALNIKDTTKYNITWHGGVTFDANGVTGNGTTGYGDTGFVPSTAAGNFSLNSGSIGVCNRGNIASGGIFMGASSGIGLDQTGLITGGAGPFNLFGKINQNGGVTSIVGFNSNGNLIVSRTGAGSEDVYDATGSINVADAPSNLTAFSLFILASNQGGLAASNIATNLDFAFIAGGLTAGQVATLQGIITTFNTALGR